ncbi:MAG TPA: hypothetical protein VIG99_19395 [Myxococcaceae bacterium]
MRATLALLLLAAVPATAGAPPFGSREELKGQVRELLLAHSCRECHLGYLKTAVPKALKVFDLAKEDWSSTMTDRQFRPLRGRLSEQATAAELDTVDHFIQAELAARAGGPTSSSAPASPPPGASSPARPEKAPSPPRRTPAP